MGNFKLTSFGLGLIVTGTLGFLAAVIISFTPLSGYDQGALPAASFLSIMMGMAFAFPSMLQDSSSGGVSTMRIIVFAVVLLFCTIYLKIGWTITKLETLTIDQKWVYILGLAFGSKAFQRFSEQEETDGETPAAKTKEKVTLTKEKEATIETTAKPQGKDDSEDISK